jgi:hypothetical protein
VSSFGLAERELGRASVRAGALGRRVRPFMEKLRWATTVPVKRSAGLLTPMPHYTLNFS